MVEKTISADLIMMARRIASGTSLLTEDEIRNFQKQTKDLGFHIGVDKGKAAAGPQTRGVALAIGMGDQYGFDVRGLNPQLIRAVGDKKNTPDVENHVRTLFDKMEIHNKATDRASGKYLAPIDKIIYANQIYQESGFNPAITGDDGTSKGLPQFHNNAGKKYGLITEADKLNPDKSLVAFVTYKADLKAQYKDPILELVRYNGGQGAIDFVKKKLGKDSITGEEWMRVMTERNEARHREKDFSKWIEKEKNAWDEVTRKYVEKIMPHWKDKVHVHLPPQKEPGLEEKAGAVLASDINEYLNNPLKKAALVVERFFRYTPVVLLAKSILGKDLDLPESIETRIASEREQEKKDLLAKQKEEKEKGKIVVASAETDTTQGSKDGRADEVENGAPDAAHDELIVALEAENVIGAMNYYAQSGATLEDIMGNEEIAGMLRENISTAYQKNLGTGQNLVTGYLVPLEKAMINDLRAFSSMPESDEQKLSVAFCWMTLRESTRQSAMYRSNATDADFDETYNRIMNSHLAALKDDTKAMQLLASIGVAAPKERTKLAAEMDKANEATTPLEKPAEADSYEEPVGAVVVTPANGPKTNGPGWI